MACWSRMPKNKLNHKQGAARKTRPFLLAEGNFMKKMQKDGYVFLTDIHANREYYRQNSLCDCSACRNFYAQISGKYPELEAFLFEFGVDIARPDELIWMEREEEVDYIAMYTVRGEVNSLQTAEIRIGAQQIVVNQTVDFPNEQELPCFGLTVSSFSLPWVLSEPFPGSEQGVFFKIVEGFKKKRKKKRA